MAAHKSKKYRGVFWILSSLKKLPNGSPDRSYYIRYKVGGKKIEEKIGWASEGITEEIAASIRAEKIVSYRKTGKFYLKPVTMDEAFQQLAEYWRSSCKDAEHQIRAYQHHLKKKFGHRTLDSIRPLEFEDLKNKLLQKYSPRYVSRILGIAKQIYNRATRWQIYYGPNPLKAVDFPKVDNRRMRYLTISEIHQLMDRLKRSPKTYLMAHLSLYFGLRPSEIFNLNWSEVDLREGHIILLDTKNMESRRVFLDEESLELLRRMSEKDPSPGLVFKNSKGEKYTKIPKFFTSVVNRLGFNKGIKDPRNKVVFYTLRHTYATYVKALGYSDTVLKDMLGHRDIKTTQRYAKMMPSVSSEVSRKIKEFLNSQRESDENDQMTVFKKTD